MSQRLREVFTSATPSATVAINERSNEMIADGQRVLKLGLGQSPFPVPDVVIAALREHAGEKDYLPVAGLRPLRQAVSDFHNRRDGLASEAGDVVVGPGSKELMFLLQLACSGDLLLPAPSWVSYAPQAAIAGKRVRWIDTRAEDGYRLAPDALEREAQSAPPGSILILNYPCNPTGMTYDAAHLAEIGQAARETGLIVLSDEIYGELHFEGKHRSIALDYPEGTIVSAGLSKWCGAGGWRLGTFTFPKQLADVRDAVIVGASETYTSVSAPIQYAAQAAFTPSEEIDTYLERSREILRALGLWCADKLTEAGAPCPRPQGGFYLFPDFSARIDGRAETSTEMCEKILDEAGVAFLPGSAFGRPATEFTARLAFVDFDGAAALAADGPVNEAFLRAHCGRVTDAIEAIAGWLD